MQQSGKLNEEVCFNNIMLLLIFYIYNTILLSEVPQLVCEITFEIYQELFNGVYEVPYPQWTRVGTMKNTRKLSTDSDVGTILANYAMKSQGKNRLYYYYVLENSFSDFIESCLTWFYCCYSLLGLTFDGANQNIQIVVCIFCTIKNKDIFLVQYM